MRTYVAVTGTLFALLLLAHLWRLYLEGSRLAADPWFMGFTVLSVAMAAWAWRLLRATRA